MACFVAAAERWMSALFSCNEGGMKEEGFKKEILKTEKERKGISKTIKPSAARAEAETSSDSNGKRKVLDHDVVPIINLIKSNSRYVTSNITLQVPSFNIRSKIDIRRNRA
jgi:hypothetical protein